MKPLFQVLALLLPVTWGCDSDRRSADSPKEDAGSIGRVDGEALIRRAKDLLARDGLGKAELKEFRDLNRALPLWAWKDGSSLQETLRLISNYREDREVIDWLHSGLNPYGKGDLLTNNDALGAVTTQAIASALLSETHSHVKRLYLRVLQPHTSRGNQKEYLHLDADTVSKLIGQWDSLKDEKGRYGLPASSYLLMLYRHYATSHEGARSFLLALARDRDQPVDFRLRALSACKWWPKGSDKQLSFVRELLAAEEPSEIRVGAVRLLDSFFSMPPNKLKASSTFVLLRELAEKDPDPKVRLQAGATFLNLDDPQTIEWLAGVLKSEKDQEVRAGILSGFPLLGYENRETNYAALRLLAQVFQNEPHAEVQKAAVVRYLRLAHFSLVVWEEEEEEASLDPVVLESLLGMAENIQKVSPGRETRVEIKQRLEIDFEKRFPVLLQISEYQQLKDYLEK